MPCNGRFPQLIALITMFFVAVEGPLGSLLGAVMLLGLIVLCVGLRWAAPGFCPPRCSRGCPPPLRWSCRPSGAPRSVRCWYGPCWTARCLYWAVRLRWLRRRSGHLAAANLRVGDTQALRLLADALDPAGRFLGMDGVILLAFILGFPANEIVLPSC